MPVRNGWHEEDAGDDAKEKCRPNKAYFGLWRAKNIQFLDQVLEKLRVILIGSILALV